MSTAPRLLASYLRQKLDPSKAVATQHRPFQQIERAGMQRIEGSGKIAAVNRRNRERRDGLECLDIVPVVDMPALLLQLLIGCERPERCTRKFGQREEAEFACCLSRV